MLQVLRQYIGSVSLGNGVESDRYNQSNDFKRRPKGILINSRSQRLPNGEFEHSLTAGHRNVFLATLLQEEEL